MAFTLESSPETLDKDVLIAKGTKVQSVPGQGELPQIFETSEDIITRPRWNALKLQLKKCQILTSTIGKIFVKGIDTGLKIGDKLLFVKDDLNLFEIVGEDQYNKTEYLSLRTVSKIQIDNENKNTIIEFVSNDDNTNSSNAIGNGVNVNQVIQTKSKFINNVINSISKTINLLDGNYFERNNSFSNNQDNNIINDQNHKKWVIGSDQAELVSFALRNNINRNDFFRLYNESARKLICENKNGYQVYAFKIISPLFGHNAQKVIPPANVISLASQAQDDFDYDIVNFKDIITDANRVVVLDTVYPTVIADGLFVLKSFDEKIACFKILQTVESSFVNTQYNLNSRCTSLKININDKQDKLLWEGEKEKDPILKKFKIRSTIVYAESKLLELEEFIPIDENNILDNHHKSIILEQDSFGLVDALSVGQPICISGKRVNDDQGCSEIAIISSIEISDDGCHTKLFLENTLKFSYYASTVTINANVSRATHGETKSEILGNGDGSQKQQIFTLNQEPLTFISSDNFRGRESTMDIRINKLPWTEVSSLLDAKSTDQAYKLYVDYLKNRRINVVFGDGVYGSRIPTGDENVEAKFRIGVGYSGLLKPGQLKNLLDKPLGVRNVTNPISAIGGEEPENIEKIRKQIPLSLMTMERLVSSSDFKNFSLCFEGIGKVDSISVWNGLLNIVYITIGSSLGEKLTNESEIFNNLKSAIEKYKDPPIRFQLLTFEMLTFNLDVTIIVSNNVNKKEIKSLIEKKLRETYSPVSRQLAQPIYKSEIILLIQEIKEVVLVNVKAFYLSGKVRSIHNFLPAKKTRWDKETKTILPADLLFINPDTTQTALNIDILEEKGEPES